MVESYGLKKEHIQVLKKLDTPKKIQDFINKIPINFEENGDTCMSPRRTLEENKAHCVEGALLAAFVLRLQGHKPLIMDLVTTSKDFDHVVALFKKEGHWGAISKTNHAVLRYRDPIYKTIRELALSYFHEYFLDNGRKTLRKYSEPFNLNRFDKIDWISSKEDLWEIAEALDDSKHHEIVSKKQIANLRSADKIEIDVGKITDWKKSK